jgi:prepilin-type processing-associated H-X9-DG protein
MTQGEERETSGSLTTGGFGSYHPGGANMAFADGSTRFISNRIEPKTLRLLGHRADGEIVPAY